MEKEYIVTLKDGVDYDEFWDQMESNTSGLSYVPDRIPDIVNKRPHNPRNTHYALSDAEVALLRQDPRVLGVELTLDDLPDVVLKTRMVQDSNFNQPASFYQYNNEVNWGLIRCIEKITRYRGSSNSPTQFDPFLYNYNYHLDGTGVDIVIHDTGLQVDHPEFTDANGNSRVRPINWYTESGIAGTQSADHYVDYEGHGTHVAGIAAGKNFGWAKNARIYALKVANLYPSNTPERATGISINDCFDVVRLWHLNKPIVNGIRRPTIVNMSWGFSVDYSQYSGQPLSGNYRGQAWSEQSFDIFTTPTDRHHNYGIADRYTLPYRYVSVDADVDLMAEAGIFICNSAGNEPYVHDLASGPDYNNYVNAPIARYYHKGCSPYTTYGMTVGAIDIGAYQNNSGSGYPYYDRQTTFSRFGPGVNIWAPGSRIVSVTSDNNTFGNIGYQDAPYQFDNNYRQITISGTSQASPQVVGVAALYLQVNPGASISEIKEFLIKSSVDTLYDENRSWAPGHPGVPVPYDHPYNLYGGPNRVLNFPFASDIGLSTTANFTARLNRKN